MKIIFTIICLVFSFNAFSQASLSGTWLNDQNECIIFGDKMVMQNERVETSHYFDFKLKQNEIVLYQTNNIPQEVERYRVLIKEHNDSLLIIKPKGKKTKTFFGKSKRIVLKNHKYYNNGTAFLFNNIKITRDRCHGYCDAFTLEIDSTGHFKLFIDFIEQGIDENHNLIFIHNQQYEGQLSAIELQSFKEKLQAINWQTFRLPEPNCRGCGPLTIDISYNALHKKYHSTSSSIILNDILESCTQIIDKMTDRKNSNQK